jgi:hypothetical protein
LQLILKACKHKGVIRLNRKRQVAGLLKRYEFIDFAKVVAVEPAQRKNHLRAYLDRNRKGRWKSYKGLRAVIPDIAGVQRGLDVTASANLSTINKGLKLLCHPEDLGFNMQAAETLYHFLQERPVDAYDDHPHGSLRIGPDRTIPMGVEHYVVDGERGIFRWVYPRRDRLLGHVPRIVMSLIHHNYVRGDFIDFEVQMIDLSCEPIVGPRGGVRAGENRNPHIVDLLPGEILSRKELNEHANHVYSLLLEISDEP